ncbi:oligosaccharide flippase family protein [bacterium]|nr:oligosaccharide flippase family protein [bacterium]
MNDDRSMGGKVGIVGSGRGIYVFSLFILNIGLARSMGTAGFGAFQQVFMFSALFMILSIGIPETLYFFLPRLTPEERPGFLGQTLLILGMGGVLVACVFWFGAPLFAGIQKNPEIVSNLRLFGLYGGFLIASSFADPIFITFKRLKYLFILSSLHGIFFIVLTVWQYITKADAQKLFIVMAVFGLVKLMLSVMYLYKMRGDTGPISFFSGRHMVLLQMSFSLPIALTNTIDIISKWLDKFVISIFYGAVPLGIYYVGAIEIPFIGVLLSSIYSVVSPVINKLHHDQNNAGFALFVNKTLKLTAKIIWPLFVYLMIFSDHLVPLVFRADYAASVPTFRIYLLLMPVRIALYGVIIIALGKPKVVFWTSFAALAVNLVLNVVLIRFIGFQGPAIATVFSTYVHVIILMVIIIRTLKVSFGDLVPVKTLFDIGITSTIAGLVAFLLTRMFVRDIKVVTMSLPIFFGAYIFLASKAGFIKILSLTDLLEGNFLGKRNDRSSDK